MLRYNKDLILLTIGQFAKSLVHGVDTYNRVAYFLEAIMKAKRRY